MVRIPSALGRGGHVFESLRDHQLPRCCGGRITSKCRRCSAPSATGTALWQSDELKDVRRLPREYRRCANAGNGAGCAKAAHRHRERDPRMLVCRSAGTLQTTWHLRQKLGSFEKSPRFFAKGTAAPFAKHCRLASSTSPAACGLANLPALPRLNFGEFNSRAVGRCRPGGIRSVGIALVRPARHPKSVAPGSRSGKRRRIRRQIAR